MLHIHCIYINLISYLEHNLCNISEEDMGGEKSIKEVDVCLPHGRLSQRGEVDPKRGSLPPEEGRLTGMHTNNFDTISSSH